MSKSCLQPFTFLNALKEFIVARTDGQFWVYANYREGGALLIKDINNDKRILLKPWDTGYPIGAAKVERFIYSTPTFKGHEVNLYVFIGKDFRNNVQRQAQTDAPFTLIELAQREITISILGSRKIPGGLLKLLIEFANSTKLSVAYDFQGILRHKISKRGKQEVDKADRQPPNPTVFVSYSWDNETHKLWVLRLASDLIRNGVKILIDEWDLDKYRDDLHYFMEAGIRESDYVLMICTPNYAQRANVRSGGVGVESTIITGEFFSEAKAKKFIPIARQYRSSPRECLPSYLKTRYAIDFKDDAKYGQRREELIRKIFNMPKYRRPKLGVVPELESEDI